jgi:endonuclease III
MPQESKTARAQRLNQILSRLQAAYPDAHCELQFQSPLELLIATILSAQSTDKQVNLVTTNLFQKYRSAADYAQTPIETLEQEIRTLGFFRNKARHIQSCCRTLRSRYHGQVPSSMESLVQLDGVGRKTANVVLGNAFHLNQGIVVDTHVTRLAQRLQLTRQRLPEKIELDLMPLVPRQLWTLFSHWLIWHGRRRCTARKPDCSQCELSDLCPSSSPAPLRSIPNTRVKKHPTPSHPPRATDPVAS